MADIDFVVPMVFPDDVLWQRDFKKSNSSYIDKHVRWRSWGTERCLIRLVKKNMPWIRTIHVLLARKSQLQYWMNDEKVHIVYHKDFIPEKFLPLFNSCAIEMFLHNIPGLSEQFLYGNDDMYPLYRLKKSDFFLDGKPCIKMKSFHYPKEPNAFQKSCMCGLNFIASRFGRKYTDTWLKNGHSIAPMLKSTCKDIIENRWEEVEMTITSFRTDYNLNQYIYSWWQYLSGNYADRSPRYRYIGAGGHTKEEMADIISLKDAIVCVNDNSEFKDYEEYAKTLNAELEKILNS